MFLSRISLVIIVFTSWAQLRGQELVGIHIVPHQFSSNLKWRQAPDPELGARVELFLQNKTRSAISIEPKSLRFDSKMPDELLQSNDWTWHNTHHSHEIELPEDSMTVIQFNGKRSNWGVASNHELSSDVDIARKLPFELVQSQRQILMQVSRFDCPHSASQSRNRDAQVDTGIRNAIRISAFD